MIAKSRQMATHDFLLALASVVVVTLAILPSPKSRQRVQLRKSDGQFQQYSLETDDPRLAVLKDELAAWLKPAPNPALTLANWQAELGEFYAQRTEARTSDRSSKDDDDTELVVAVSFKDNLSTSTSRIEAAGALRQQHEYWVRFRRDANAEAARQKEKDRQRRSMLSAPPIVFGDAHRGRHSAGVYVFTGLLGVAVGLFFAGWTYVCPSISLMSDTARSVDGVNSVSDGKARELRMTLPARWVRIHQPMMVTVRQSAYAVLIVAAIACVIL